MDRVILAVLVIGTLGLCYVFVVQIGLQAGKNYPDGVRVPALAAALATLAAGIVEALQLFGILGVTTFAYQLSLALSLIGMMIALWVLAVRL